MGWSGLGLQENRIVFLGRLYFCFSVINACLNQEEQLSTLFRLSAFTFQHLCLIPVTYYVNNVTR